MASAVCLAPFGMTISSQPMVTPSRGMRISTLRVFHLHLEEVAAVAVDEVKLSGVDAGLVAFVVEAGDVLLPADEHVAVRRRAGRHRGC
jgi:hypothetical protein